MWHTPISAVRLRIGCGNGISSCSGINPITSRPDVTLITTTEKLRLTPANYAIRNKMQADSIQG